MEPEVVDHAQSGFEEEEFGFCTEFLLEGVDAGPDAYPIEPEPVQHQAADRGVRRPNVEPARGIPCQ